MGSHSVTCHLTQVNTPRLNPEAGTRFTYPGGMEGWDDLGDWFTRPRWIVHSWELNSQHVDHKSDALTNTTPSHPNGWHHSCGSL